MIGRFGFLLLVLSVVSCRSYDYYSRLSSQRGLTPPDQFARYGREQAEAVAIAREFGKSYQGNTPDAFAKQAQAAVSYAKTLPDVVDVTPDPLGNRLTIRFKSGWREAVNPVDDGKKGGQTPGIAAPAQPAR
ncbi:MAG TPA: hypothetical protein VH763_00940 [Gemmatimonadales bacterium]|jgi:hypothetical protein